VGYLALVQARPVAAQKFLESVLAHEAPEPWTRAAKILGKHIGLAAILAVEAGEALPPRMQRRIAEAFADWLCDGAPRDVAEAIPEEDLLGRVSQWLRQIALSEIAKPFIDALLRRAGTGDARGRRRAVESLETMEAPIPRAVLENALVGDPVARPSSFGTLLAEDAKDPLLARVLAQAGDEGMRILVDHADKPAARAALWQWAEARQWVFTPP
jgi:hypothetical protein